MAPRKKGPQDSQLSCYIPEDLHESLRDYSEESGVRISRIVADALTEYLSRRKRRRT